MSTIDLSRSATDFRKHFTGVEAQMGRVVTDDDHNENERLHGEDLRRSRLDIIGPAGSPDAGFSIANPTVTPAGIDFDIVAGTLYLGGNRLTLEANERFQVQSDWLNMDASDIPAAPAGPRLDLVYLECWQQSVCAVEDNELFEVALGGPDTGTRARLMRRVRVFANATAGDCTTDWNTLTGTWSSSGLGTFDPHAELLVNTQLQVGFVPGPPGDLCTPAIAGGYLGADNQAIRVQLVDGSTFTWGFDNAAPLYRVTVGANAGGQLRKITLITQPKDQAHWPVSGQIIELLPWSAVLPNLEKIAEVSGFLAVVDTSYDPDTNELFITTDVPAGFGEQWLTRPDAPNLKPEFLFMRLWNRGSDTTSPPAIAFVNGTPVTLGSTGLTVTFSGSDHHPNDYWIIAARPESPNLVVPWLLETGRGPTGIRRWYTPLAEIQWTPGSGGQVIDDCRDTFPPLTQIRGCCTYTVGDGVHSFGDFTNIQQAINSLPADGGEICIRPGVYRENVTVKGLHDIRIHGCGSHTLLEDGGKATSPVITIQDSQRIQICDLAIQSPSVIAVELLSTPAAEAKNVGLQAIALKHLRILTRDLTAIDCRGGREIEVFENRITAGPLIAGQPGSSGGAGQFPLIFMRADDVLIERNEIVATGLRAVVLALGGVQVGGGSERVAIRRNLIQGGNGNGITLGSISYLSPNGNPLDPGGGVIIGPGGGVIIDPNGCVGPDPNPQNPTGPDGNPLTPQSDGDLQDIRILDNTIAGMGQSGISTLRFFNAGVITVRGLDIELNRILRCVQLELGDNPFVTPLTLGFGAVALIAVERLTLRNNFMEDCGQSFIDPICGLYILMGRGIVVEANQILENGPRVQTGKQQTAGPRGGIFIALAQTPMLGSKVPVAGVGFPAARITGNTVIAPTGRALYLVARGLVSVNNNELTSCGVDQTAAAFGVTVLIFNLGVTYEIAQFTGFSSMALNTPTRSLNSAASSKVVVGGETLFGDNQVLLAPVGEGPAIISSIELLSLDDVQFTDNECEARVGRQPLFFHGLALAWSVRMNSNRFEEALTVGLSGLTFGVFNCTALNQGTRCFGVLGAAALTENTGNRSLTTLLALNAGQADPCAALQKRLTAAFSRFGFSG